MEQEEITREVFISVDGFCGIQDTVTGEVLLPMSGLVNSMVRQLGSSGRSAMGYWTAAHLKSLYRVNMLTLSILTS